MFRRQFHNQVSPGIYVAIPGKALFALEIELDLGYKLYPATNHDVVVWREGSQYWFQRLDIRNGGTPLENGLELPPESISYVHMLPKERPASGQVIQAITMQYESLAALMDDWPMLSARSVWSTQQTPDRLAWRPRPFTL